MKDSLTGLLTLAGAAALVVGVTVWQGSLTERWKDKSVSKDLERAAKLLEETFPAKFGNWEYELELESNPKELERAGAVGHISKLYRNTRTKSRVSAFIVCARPHDASGHTPDRCYPGAGFEIGEAEHRQKIRLLDGSEAETFTGTFKKQGQTLRIFWTYGIRDEAAVDRGDITAKRSWIAPQVARLGIVGEPAVYKLYAIVDESRSSTSAQSMIDCEDFIAHMLPAMAEAIAATAEAPSAADDPPAEAGTDAPAEGPAEPAAAG